MEAGTYRCWQNLFLVGKVAVLLLGTFSVCWGQQTQSAIWHVSRMPLTVNGELTISLNGIPSSSHYILGVRCDSGSTKAALSISQVILGESTPSMPSPMPASITDWTDVILRRNYVQVEGLQSLQGALALYAEVPPNTTLRVTVNGKTVSHLTTSSNAGIIVNDGVTSTDPDVNANKLLVTLITPQSSQSMPAMVRLPSGAIFASRALLRANLISFSLPNAVSTRETVGLELQIDENGNVVSTRDLDGNSSPFAQSCEQAVATWKFRPFLLNGKATSVTGRILLVSQDGKVRTDIAP